MAPILRLLAIASSLLIAVSFLLFATDEMDRGSKTQQQALAEETGVPVAPSPEEESVREHEHSPLREAIDDANDLLLQPFSGVANSNSNWVTRGVPTLLGLLVYGIGLGLLANLLPGRPSSQAGDWRTA
jgi:hypothetical protein